MKKIWALILVFVLTVSLSSCGKRIGAYEFMVEFAESYPLDGVIYRSGCNAADDGFVDSKTFKKIFVYNGELPSDFAFFLNSRTERGAECGIFVYRDSEEKEAFVDMCLERIRIVADKNAEGVVLCSGGCVFYSTLPDAERAKSIFYRIIK